MPDTLTCYHCGKTCANGFYAYCTDCDKEIDDTEIEAKDDLRGRIDALETQVEAAFFEGYREGHSNGLSDGHPQSRTHRDSPRDDWQNSDARVLLDAP